MADSTASGAVGAFAEGESSGWSPVPGFSPLTITLVYLAFGFAFLLVSDVLLVRYLSDPLLGRVQAVKGALEVLLTAGLIFTLTRWRERELGAARSRLEWEQRELQILHRVLRHNLRNDLCVLRSHVDMLARRFEGEPDECSKLRSVLDRMSRYTDQAKRIRQATDNDQRTRRFSLAETMPDVLEANDDVTENVDLETTLQDVRVEANYMFPEALSELVTNAVVHNDSETPRVRLTVDTAGAPAGMVEIRVSDDGPGIPADEREPLQLDREDQMIHLSGLGLWFVKWTVELSGGEITFAGDDDGTTIRTHLPRVDEQ